MMGGLSRLRKVRHASYSLKQWTKMEPDHSSIGLGIHRPQFSPIYHLPKADRLSQRSAKLPLFAELFPEEINKEGGSKPLNEDANLTVPPLPLPNVKELLEDFGIQRSNEISDPKEASQVASSDAYKHRKTAVLVLQCASKSLVESDFRRIAPKGKHIHEWTGPGDILTVFPARDPNTFEQSDHYFIVFANPAYARAYQSHVHRLYRMAREQTPTSVESPLTHQRGVTINGEDAYAMLQDFALCPPSHRLKLLYIYDYLSPSMSRLLDHGGYLRLSDGTDRAGRAVLFWADGYSPTSQELNTIIASDGRDRGMAWDVSISKLDVLTENEGSSEDFGQEYAVEDHAHQRSSQRWILTFSNEHDARRFTRAWHRTHLDSSSQEEPHTVHAEFLW